MKKNESKIKSALITGGTRGIGYAVAEALLKEGMNVFICGTNQAGVDKAVHQLDAAYSGRIGGTVCDVRSYEQIRGMIRRVAESHGGLDVLVNNAGIGHFSSVEKMDPEVWRAVIETNLSSLFYTCHEVIPLMRKRGSGYIINIGSLAGRNFFPGGSAYSASKAGLIGFSEALMQEIRHDHIRVSYIMPGSVETEFGGSTPAAKTWKLMPADIADAVLSLLRSNARSLSSRIEIRPSEPNK